MRTAEQRIAAFDARMVSSLLDPVFVAVSPLAKANFTAYVLDFVPKQEQLRQLLSALAIPTADFFTLEAFNHEMYHLSRVAAGEAAITTATPLVAKYVTWGATESVLIQICSDIWNIVVPPA